ncbi:MAG: SagB/ThcOx family dehydrogenase [Candidatus Eisenbacteria bacterium]|nr:SagB/ThcOx family dehydrogenase [Candidatus Eisenbacteria bacterium]
MSDESIDQYREFLKDTVRLVTDFTKTDQNTGVPMPPVEKPFAPGAKLVDLPGRDEWQTIGTVDVATAIANRRSHRVFRREPLNLEEVAFLLWATQGVRERLQSGNVRRTVPSAGCRHAVETYLGVLNVGGLEEGVYRYLPLEHKLVLEFLETGLSGKLSKATFDQSFVGKAPVTFVWTTIPYRMEWRYSTAAHKVIALDTGHICQNLYLACQAIGGGTCAIAAYNQVLMDKLLRLDGKDEFVIYLAPVGKV